MEYWITILHLHHFQHTENQTITILAYWLNRARLFTWSCLHTNFNYYLLTWAVSIRFSQVLNTVFPEPSILSFRHSTLSLSIFSNKLYWSPISSSFDPWSQLWWWQWWLDIFHFSYTATANEANERNLLEPYKCFNSQHPTNKKIQIPNAVC